MRFRAKTSARPDTSVRGIIALIAFALIGVSCGDDSSTPFQVDVIDALESGIDISMVRFPRGSFVMGSPYDSVFMRIYVNEPVKLSVYMIERPKHNVTVSSFRMSIYEISQEQYRAVTGDNPSRFAGFDNLPVENVTWYDAARFCNELSGIAGLEPCYDTETWECDFTNSGFRLPTEAEWEYACRAGSQLEYGVSETTDRLGRFAWFAENSLDAPNPVGEKEPNAAGLFDMQGNVYEWCNDFLGRYPCSSQTDPMGFAGGFMRVIKGGAWSSTTRELRPASRRGYLPETRNALTGFRVVCR